MRFATKKFCCSPIFLLIVASCVTFRPFIFHVTGSDVYFYTTYLDCFSRQFWQGDLLPHWCFDADESLGSPVFLFYPPLAYYAGSLMAPLFGPEAHFAPVILSIIIVSLITAFTCWHWLREIVGPKAALFGVVIYLALPYRSEVMVMRSNISELWLIAFAPLMCHAARGVLLGRPYAAVHFSFWLALSLLSHPPGALGVLMGLAIHVLIAAGKDWRILPRFIVSGAGAAAVTLFYSLPAMHYSVFTHIHEKHAVGPIPWPDDFLHIFDIFPGSFRAIGALALSTLAFLALGLTLWRGLDRIPEAFERIETRCWIMAGLFALFMIVPLSKPLWNLIALFGDINFPWRIQTLLMLSVTCLAATYARWLVPSHRSTIFGDGVAVFLFLCFVQWFLTNERILGGFDFIERAWAKRFAAHAVFLPEYQTVWTSKEQYSRFLSQSAYDSLPAQPQLTVLEGSVVPTVKAWDWSGIILHIEAQGPSIIRLRHRYFPIWHAQADGGQVVSLLPEKDTGLMLLSVPAGSYTVTIKQGLCWINCSAEMQMTHVSTRK